MRQAGTMIKWDAERYQARHSYVFAYGESLIEMLDARSGDRIPDLGCGSVGSEPLLAAIF